MMVLMFFRVYEHHSMGGPWYTPMHWVKSRNLIIACGHSCPGVLLCCPLVYYCAEQLCHSFIHSFIQAVSIGPLQVHYYSEALRHSMDTVSDFHTEAPQATASEELAQCPYVAARATVWPKVILEWLVVILQLPVTY